MKRFFTPILALTLLTPLILAENSRAIAGQKCRGCSGKIRIRNINEGIHPVRGSSIHPVLGSTIHKPASWFIIAEASGRACASNATRCRKRARDAMIRMYKNIWEKRWTHSTHGASSLWPPNKPGRPVAGLRWSGIYPHIKPDSLKDRIEATACCDPRVPSNGLYKFDLEFSVNGDRGCDGREPWKGYFQFFPGYLTNTVSAATAYTVDCREVRRRGLCG